MEKLAGLLSFGKPRQPKLQIMSDLHLEVGQQYASFQFPATAPFLVLAGDIGRLVDYQGLLGFLERQAPRYRKVFLALGNHEFYGTSYEQGLDAARRLVREPRLQDKVVLLHRTRWDDPDSRLTVLGCTLWSRIPPAAEDVIRFKVSDFKQIEGWSIQKHNQQHGEEARWLLDQARQLAGAQSSDDARRAVCIVTHHAPSLVGTSSPQHADGPVTPAFATELLLSDDDSSSTRCGGRPWEAVRAWVFGHTHYSTDFACRGIRVVANQRGYVFAATTAAREKRWRRRDVHQFDPAKAIAV
ncbi:hypothetical protein VTK73DRAFT_3375 [Phialemonium thermophilum]|uniref:Calcineurin-like phosphoesterase domain-containing protein n=1 Tax=Phialemonium thermophilum TaxID=223376 RepID=A0ABR3VJJ1_9PEZI